MFSHPLPFDRLGRLRPMALAILATLAVTMWTREEAKQIRSAEARVCEPRGKAGAACHALPAGEVHAGGICESFGRGGRLCYAPE